MAGFDFLASHPRYRDDAETLARLNKRYDFLIEPFREDIKDAHVLDLAAHDGRWGIALAQAGAASVIGIEARPELVAQFDALGDIPAKARVTMEVDDIFDSLDKLLTNHQRFDVIVVFGILYHVMDHFRLLRQCVELGPKLILVDSEFMTGRWPFIKMLRERTDNQMNATPQIKGQTMAVKGVPSGVALERMAEALDCSVEWVAWEELAPEDRAGVQDYFRGPDEKKIRRSCTLRPLSSASKQATEG